MAAKKKKNSTSQLKVNLQIDDETLDELISLEGESVVKLVIWDESILDALDDVNGLPTIDVDIYLEDNVLFELYGVLSYTSLDDDPSSEPCTILNAYDGGVAILAEVAVDNEDDLVLVLQRDTDHNLLYLNIGAWSVDEWEELPV